MIRNQNMHVTISAVRGLVLKNGPIRIVLLFALVAAFGCAREEKIDEASITPATPPPAVAPTDTDIALTETTEVGEDRSINEGGVLTDPNYGGDAGTVTTGTSGTPPPQPR